MGNLVVGNYDLKPTVHGGLISANAFIYNMTSRQWTLLRLGGSQSSQTTLYGIWQDGGPGSPRYTLAGGSAASGAKQAFLMNYNEHTGRFGAPEYYSYGNHRGIDTHFEGITAVRGGFNLVALSAPQGVSMAFIPVPRPQRPFRPRDLVSRQCHEQPAMCRRLQPGDREYRLPEPGDGHLRPERLKRDKVLPRQRRGEVIAAQLARRSWKVRR